MASVRPANKATNVDSLAVVCVIPKTKWNDLHTGKKRTNQDNRFVVLLRTSVGLLQWHVTHGPKYTSVERGRSKHKIKPILG